MPIAIVLLIINFIKKKPKKIPIITLVTGFLFFVSGFWVIGSNLSPEELAELAEQREIKEREALEKERLEEEEALELKKKEETELQAEKDKSEKKEKELAAKEKMEKEKERLAAKDKEQKDEKEKIKTQAPPKEPVDKTADEKGIEKEPVPINSKDVIYTVFKSGDDEIDETITNFEFDEGEKILTATVKGKDGWSDKSIGLGFYEDSTAVYRELAKDERIAEAWLTITFPMKDTYGNVEDEEVMSTWMSRGTMDKINWKTFDYQKLVDVVDGKRIYPQFVQ